MRQHRFLPRMALSLLVLFGLMQFSTLAFGASGNHISANPRVNESVSYEHWKVELAAIGAPGPTGGNPAVFNIYHNGKLTNSTELYPEQNATYLVGKQIMNLYVVNTYDVYPRPLSASILMSFSDEVVKASAGKSVTLYLGDRAVLGKWGVQLDQFGSPVNNITPAAFSISYNGVLTNQTALTEYYPNDVATFTVKGHVLHLNVTQIEDGLYYYQQWTKIKLSQSR